MTTMTTVADRILDRLLAGDGCRERTRLGVRVHKLLERVARHVDQDWTAGTTTYMFRDGSELVACDTGIDTPAGWAANT